MQLDFTLYETLKSNQRDDFKVTSQHHITNDENEIFKLINNSIQKIEIGVRIETDNETWDFKTFKVENGTGTVKMNLKVHCQSTVRIFNYRQQIQSLLYDYYQSSNLYAIQLIIDTDFHLEFNIYYKY